MFSRWVSFIFYGQQKVPHSAKISQFFAKNAQKCIKNTSKNHAILSLFNSFLTNRIKSVTLYPILTKGRNCNEKRIDNGWLARHRTRLR